MIVSVDPEKMKAFPAINNWFFLLKPKKEQNKDHILAEMERAGGSIMRLNPVIVDIRSLPSEYAGAYAICPECKESYSVNEKGLCLPCQGSAYYVIK